MLRRATALKRICDRQRVQNAAAKRTAKMSANSASFFGLYQPKEPDMLKKKEK